VIPAPLLKSQIKTIAVPPSRSDPTIVRQAVPEAQVSRSSFVTAAVGIVNNPDA